MSIGGIEFLTFITATYLVWRYVLRHDDARRNWLLLASYYFYCTFDLRFALVLLATTVAQWLIGARIFAADTQTTRRAWLWVSLGVGLGTLGYFKYAGFFVESLNALLESLGLAASASVLELAAPIGISFYTFQSLTYTIDIYRRKEIPTRNLRNFALFIAFFPHVTAGPIARARLLIPQIEAPQRAGALDPQAVFLIARGLAKKIAIADVLAAQFVTPAFASPDQWASWFLALAVIAYSFQIYMDLSGYTDIARGAARCFGYDLQVNFDRPYLARTVSNFWQRWHISMSSFFREYLYWSLGGSRQGIVYVNLIVTFVAIGLWHGAGWNFVLYGLLHGSVVCVERMRRLSRRRRGLPDNDESFSGQLIGLTYTFVFVAFARILFVESDLAGATGYVRNLWLSQGTGAAAGMQGYATLAAAIALHILPRTWEQSIANRAFRMHPALQGCAIAILAYTLVALASESRPFVYFQF